MSTSEFKSPGMPSAPSKKDIANAVAMFAMKYRVHNHIFPYEQLTHDQVDEILDGIEDMLYQYEELRPRKDEDFDDDDGTTSV